MTELVTWGQAMIRDRLLEEIQIGAPDVRVDRDSIIFDMVEEIAREISKVAARSVEERWRRLAASRLRGWSKAVELLAQARRDRSTDNRRWQTSWDETRAQLAAAEGRCADLVRSLHVREEAWLDAREQVGLLRRELAEGRPEREVAEGVPSRDALIATIADLTLALQSAHGVMQVAGEHSVPPAARSTLLAGRVEAAEALFRHSAVLKYVAER